MPLLLLSLSPILAGLGFADVPWWGNLLIALWFWCFGANVGSFMNVVVFRLPLGRSVVHPRSRCPKCGNWIAWFDNLPVLSWLLLRGQCRHCALPIAARYPTVEALVAAIFLVLAFVGPATGGGNLPPPILKRPALVVMEYEFDVMLWLLYAFHMLLICTLICAALIRYDRYRAPWRLYVPALVVGFVAPLIWPDLRPVACHEIVDSWLPSVGAALDGICGLLMGALLGLAASTPRWRPNRQRLLWSEIPALGLCGLFLGWQAISVLAVIAGVLDLLSAGGGPVKSKLLRCPWVGHLVVGTVVYLMIWRPLAAHASWLVATEAAAWTSGAAIGLLYLVTNLAVLVAQPYELKTPPLNEAWPEPGAIKMESPLEGTLHAIVNSPSYRLAEEDIAFLKQPELRPIRMQLELLKPEMALSAHGVRSTIVAFGSTQIAERPVAEERLRLAREALAAAPQDTALQRRVARAERMLVNSQYYDAAREFGRLVSSACQTNGAREYVIVTGGGPGIMEAANRGAYDVGAKSIGLNITLPAEQVPNPYITPGLCFQFHYFALRKMHFLLRAKALVVFPGGFGTLDELTDALTLRQTNRMQAIPIILFRRAYWERVIDFQFLADEGAIADEHLSLIQYAETPAEAWEIIVRFHGG